MRLVVLLFLIFLLSASACFGQLTIQQMQPFFNGQLLSTYLVDATYRWRSSDIGSNATISGNWTDTILGTNWLMGAASQQPTNTGSTNGIWFDSSHWLTNAGAPISSNVSIGFIIKIIDNGRGGTKTRPTYITSGTNGTASAGAAMFGDEFRDPFSQDYPLEGYTRNGVSGPFVAGTGNLTNLWIDLIFSQNVTNSTGTGNQIAITNGVNTVLKSALDISDGFGAIHTANSVASSNNFPMFLMRNPKDQTSIHAFVREVWIWSYLSTNGLLSSFSVSNFHYYRTNLYGP